MAQGQACAHIRPGGARRGVGTRPPAGVAVEPTPRRPGSEHGRVRDGGEDVQGNDRRAPRVADERAPAARDGPAGYRSVRASRARRRDRTRRSAVLDALSRRSGPSLRTREALPAGQEPGRSGHDRRPPRAATEVAVTGARAKSETLAQHLIETARDT